MTIFRTKQLVVLKIQHLHVGLVDCGRKSHLEVVRFASSYYNNIQSLKQTMVDQGEPQKHSRSLKHKKNQQKSSYSFDQRHDRK